LNGDGSGVEVDASAGILDRQRGVLAELRARLSSGTQTKSLPFFRSNRLKVREELAAQDRRVAALFSV
jgi:hypothetical protein